MIMRSLSIGLVLVLNSLAGSTPGWADLPNAISFSGRIPSFLTDATGTVHCLYIANHGESERLMYTRPFADEAPVPLTGRDETLSHWPESRPQLAVHNGELFAFYTVRVSGKEGADAGNAIRYRTAGIDGASWSDPRALSDAEHHAYRACVAASASPANGVSVTWLEERNERVGVCAVQLIDGQVNERGEPYDSMACECCSTELLTASSGDLYLAYRNVTPENVRDIHIAKSQASALTLGPPKRLSRDRWVLPGCPDSGARLAEDARARVWVAWYTGNPAGVYASVTEPESTAFAPRMPVAQPGGSLTRVAHPDVGTLADGAVVVVYEATRGSVQSIELRRWIETDRTWSEPEAIGTRGQYPQVVTTNTSAYIAYTEAEGEKSSVMIKPVR